jgi:hypothetical protein
MDTPAYIACFHAHESRALAELHDMLNMLAEIQVIGALNFLIHDLARVINHSQKGFEVLPVGVAISFSVSSNPFDIECLIRPHHSDGNCPAISSSANRNVAFGSKS